MTRMGKNPSASSSPFICRITVEKNYGQLNPRTHKKMRSQTCEDILLSLATCFNCTIYAVYGVYWQKRNMIFMIMFSLLNNHLQLRSVAFSLA